MKEQFTNPLTLSPEQMLNAFRERVNISGKPIVLISDLDGTLASTHTFDNLLKVHVPNLKRELVESSQLLRIPLLIATGRSCNDPSIKTTWELLSRPPMPIIGENGGLIINPATNEVRPTASATEINSLKEIALNLESSLRLLRASSIVPSSHEILIDNTRLTSIEIRIQERDTKVGSPKIHQESGVFLKNTIGRNSISVICSDSSVSIHPSSISKGNTARMVLESLGIDRSKIFIVALGDADNDQSLFNFADLGIGVGPSTIGKSEVTCLGGEKTSIAIIKAIGAMQP